MLDYVLRISDGSRYPAGLLVSIQRSDGTSIPPVAGNSDFATFLVDWRAGATVTDTDGTAVAYTETNAISMGVPFN